jgi:DnaK suppressor protein
MKEAERAELKAKIEATIIKTEEEIAHLEEMTKPIGPENAIGRVSRMDAINNKSVAEATLRSARRKLSNLRIALSKIDSPGFGICSRCKKPIPAPRLLFMPQSTRCVRCADR